MWIHPVKWNIFFTFLSSVGASAASLLTVPVYLHLIGSARYGVVAFVWLIVGYFGLFVLGLDKAITNQLAQHRHAPDAARSLFSTAMLLNAVASGAGGVILYLIGYHVLAEMLAIDNGLRSELLPAMPWIAASVPLATTTSLLIGALEAYGCFQKLAYTQFFSTIVFQVVPIAVAWHVSPALTWVVPAAILSRAGMSLWMLVLLWPVMKLSKRPELRRHWIPGLLHYGSLIGVSGIVGPILSTLDRVLIGATMGASAVSFYVVPSNLMNVVQIVPGSLLRVLFPQLSILSFSQARIACLEATLGLAAVLTPLLTLGILFANAFMSIWLGPAFAAEAQDVAKILLAGAWINCLAWVPVTLLQAQGRPGVIARLHVIELAPFVFLVWVGIVVGGVYGAATACAIRMLVDSLLLFRAADLIRPLAGKLAFPACVIVSALTLSMNSTLASRYYYYYCSVAVFILTVSLIWSVAKVPVDFRDLLRKSLSLPCRPVYHRRPTAWRSLRNRD